MRVFVVMSGDRLTILSVRGCSCACLGGGAWRSIETFFAKDSRFPRCAESVFLQISRRAPQPWKPHEMAQQVAPAVIPAGLEDEKREKLASVFQAMTDKETPRRWRSTSRWRRWSCLLVKFELHIHSLMVNLRARGHPPPNAARSSDLISSKSFACFSPCS